MGSVIVDTDFPHEIVRRGARDARRHTKRVEEAARKQMKDIITSQDIITSEGNKKVRVRLKHLDSFRFRHYPDRADSVGRDEFDEIEDGEIIHRPEPGVVGSDHLPGNERGDELYEVEFTLEELTEMMIQELDLPDLDEAKKNEIVSDRIEWTDRRKKAGIRSLIDKKQTLIANIKRKAMQGGKGPPSLIDDDLRFRTWEVHEERHSNAVIFLMMDRSGSMWDDRIYAVKALYFWMVQFLRRKYDRVVIKFIAHDAYAKEMNEKEFFTYSSSGGTIVSSAYELCRDIIHHNYPSSSWNIYCFHASDGGTWGDEDVCISLVDDLVKLGVTMFGYAEILLGGWGPSGKDPSSKLYGKMHDMYLSGAPVLATTIDSLDKVMEAIQYFCRKSLDHSEVV